MASQMIQIIVLAAIALFLILRLRNVLGTREGFEKPRELPGGSASRRRDHAFEVIEGGSADPDISHYVEPDSEAGKALAAMKAADPDFSVAEFAHGARSAYEMIVMAYENGDLETLRRFLAPEVFEPFRCQQPVGFDQDRHIPGKVAVGPLDTLIIAEGNRLVRQHGKNAAVEIHIADIEPGNGHQGEHQQRKQHRPPLGGKPHLFQPETDTPHEQPLDQYRQCRNGSRSAVDRPLRPAGKLLSINPLPFRPLKDQAALRYHPLQICPALRRV